MPQLLLFLKSSSDMIDLIARWLSMLYAALVTVVVLGSVVLRMAGHAPTWSEELARWLLIGIAFVSSSVALKRGGHIGITVLVKKVTSRFGVKILVLIVHLVVLISLACICWYGFESAIKAAAQSGDIIPISIVYAKLQIPIGSLMMTVHVLYYFVAGIQAKDPKEFMLST